MKKLISAIAIIGIIIAYGSLLHKYRNQSIIIDSYSDYMDLADYKNKTLQRENDSLENKVWDLTYKDTVLYDTLLLDSSNTVKYYRLKISSYYNNYSIPNISIRYYIDSIPHKNDKLKEL